MHPTSQDASLNATPKASPSSLLPTLKHHRTQITTLTTLIHTSFTSPNESPLLILLTSQSHIPHLHSLRAYLEPLFQGGTVESLGVLWHRTVFISHILTLLDFLISRLSAFRRYLLQTRRCESVEEILETNYDDALLQLGDDVYPFMARGFDIQAGEKDYVKESLRRMWDGLQELWVVVDEVVVRYRGVMEARARMKIVL